MSTIKPEVNRWNDVTGVLVWSPCPKIDDGRNSYNPTILLNGIMICRDDAVNDIFKYNCDSKYTSIKCNISDGVVSFDTKYSDIYFITNDSMYVTGRNRNVCSKKFPVVEDLRQAVGGQLVTGGLLYNRLFRKNQQAVFKYDSKGITLLQYVCAIASPHQRRVEKNWLFIKHSDKWIVLYNIINSQGIESFSWKYGESVLSDRKIFHWKYPNERLDHNGKHKTLRMSAVADNQDNTYILLFHHKCFKDLYYSYYCMYLDKMTLLPVSYLRFPVLTSLAVRIVFVMQILVDENHLYFCTGISDEVAGVASCNKGQWERHRTPCSK